MLVEQLAYFFAGDVKFAHVFTHANLLLNQDPSEQLMKNPAVFETIPSFISIYFPT